jgi:hypothetical protein
MDGLRQVGDFTAAVATNAAMGLPVEALPPTHRTTAPLLFYRQGGVFVFPAGSLVHVFPSTLAARMAGLPAEVWEGISQWACKKNVEGGYLLAWIEGDLRGVHPSHLELLS